MLALKYPTTRQQKNNAGSTALQIAQKQGFNRIAYVLETGKPAPQTTEENSEAKAEGPKHTRIELLQAATNGHLRVIREFIDERYDSMDEKRKLCYELIVTGKKGKQYEVVNILEPYYKQQLKAEIPSDIERGDVVRLNKHYKKVLLGFLTGLGRIIADSPTVLDPADPNTYKDMLSNMTSKQREHSQELKNLASESDIKKLSERDMAYMNGKLEEIQREIDSIHSEKDALQKRTQETVEELKEQQVLSAIQRRDLFNQKEEQARQWAAFECSQRLLELQQESILARKNTMHFIRESPNMHLFFRTVENLLQALCYSALSARSGLFTMGKNSKFGTGASTVEKLPISMIPVGKVITL